MIPLEVIMTVAAGGSIFWFVSLLKSHVNFMTLIAKSVCKERGGERKFIIVASSR